MLYASDIIFLQDLDCFLHFPDGDIESFVLEAPNGEDGFQFTIREIQDAHYRDAERNRRKGFRETEINLKFDYSSHRMELNKLLVASFIDIKFGDFPVPFTNTIFVFDSDSVDKNWLSNYVIAQESGAVIPSGEATLPFKSEDISNLT